MNVSTFDFPVERQERLQFMGSNGEDCSFYVQETSWHSNECESCWKNWNGLYAGVSRELQDRHTTYIQDRSTPWYQSLALVETTPSDQDDLRCVQEGIWVGYRQQKKRTRNPQCFRGTRYWVCWKPGSPPPHELSQLYDVSFLTMPASPAQAPCPEDAPIPGRLVPELSPLAMDISKL